MGFFGAICSVVSSVASGFASAISSAVSSIGSALSSFAATVGPVIANVIEALKPVAEAIGKFANAFLQGMGILKPDEKVEDLGERALQAAAQGITLDEFENFDDYMDALRTIELDPEVSSKRSTAEKLVAGLGVGTIGVEDKYNAERGSLNGMWLLPMSNPDYFTPERMQSLISTGRFGGDVFAYLENRLSGGEARNIEKKLELNADGQRMNEDELGTLYSALDSAQGKWAEITKQIENRNMPSQ